MKVLDRFRGADFEKLRVAVAEAEQRTAGEIVIYVVGECDPYPEAVWAGSSFGALFGLVGGVAWHVTSASWGFAGIPGGIWTAVVAPVLLGMTIAALLVPRFDFLRRSVLGREVVTRRVELRAESAFLEEEVFATRERTGVLVFLALFERRALVVGDRGIAAQVEQNEWDRIVELLVSGMKRGDPAAALLDAVAECGALLERHEVEVRHDDRDELANEPRIRER